MGWVECGKNKNGTFIDDLFDLSMIIDGYTFDESGNIVARQNWGITDYIDVRFIDEVWVAANLDSQFNVMCDENKNVIKVFASTAHNSPIETYDASYIRFTSVSNRLATLNLLREVVI